MKNITDIKNCYGCGVCSLACAKNIIDLKLNKEGFYIPYITKEKECTGCGLCIDVCSFKNIDSIIQEKPLSSYAGWSKEFAVQRKCSSGGVGFEVGRALIQYGYQLCGVLYNTESNRAEHYIASTQEELIRSIGSKYIQSYTVEAFRQLYRKKNI